MAEDKRDALPGGRSGSHSAYSSLSDSGQGVRKTYYDGVDSGAEGNVLAAIDDIYYPATNRTTECVIFNITKFHALAKYSNVFDNESEVQRLRETLESLGHVCTVHKDTSAAQVCEELERLAANTELLMRRDGFLCWIITYGKKNTLYATDGKLDFDDIIKPFTGASCKGLFGKPKLFFFQVMNDEPKSFWTTDAIGSAPAKEEPGVPCRIPAMADFYFAYSSAPGFFETADDKNTAHFIKIVNKVLKEKVTEDGVELSTLMAYIVEESREYFKNEKKSEAACYQLPCAMSTLTRDVLLYKQKKSG